VKYLSKISSNLKGRIGSRAEYEGVELRMVGIKCSIRPVAVIDTWMSKAIKNAAMKIIIVLLIISTITGSAMAAPGQPPMDLLMNRFDECSAPLIKFEAALDAVSKAQDEYISVYALANAAQETGRVALTKLESQKTYATILFYQLIGAAPESITNLEEAENVLDSDLINLLEPAVKGTKIDKSQFLAHMHKIDLDQDNIDNIEKNMNITLRIPASATLEDSSDVGSTHVTFISVLSKQNHDCYAKIRKEIQTGKWSITNAIPISNPINLKSIIQQQREIQQAQLELMQLQKMLNEPRK